MYSRTWFWVLVVVAALVVSATEAGAHPHPERELLAGSPIDQFFVEDAAVMLLLDPCPEYGTAPPRDVRRERAECWLHHSFPENERATALAVAELESDWRPEVCFNWHTKEDRECQPPLVSRTNGLPGSCFQGRQCSDYGTATGLFQQRWGSWPERAEKTMAALGLAGFGDRLNIWSGWHQSLVSAWLAGTHGWAHWDACRESNKSDKSPHPQERRCGPGKWL